MENFFKSDNNNFFDISSPFVCKNNNEGGTSYNTYINYQTQNKNIINNSNNINKKRKEKEKENTNLKNNQRINMNSFYMNMIRYNLIGNNNINNNNFFRPISTKINSLLSDFNKQLEEEEEKSKNKNVLNKNDKIINKNNFEPLIKKLESQDDERFKKSRFLKFIKDINANKIIINEEKNIIEKNLNYIDNMDSQKFENDNKKDDGEVDDANELENLLKQVEMYMNYSREDLAQNILEQIFDDSKIKLKENKQYLIKAYHFLILCYFNENEDLLAICTIIDLLYLIINEDNNNEINKYTYLYGEKYVTKEYIEKINQRNFDITDKEQYSNYIDSKQKIHEEIVNYIKNIIITNNKENYNQTLLLLYGLILYLNEKYTDAESAFNQLIILDSNNYFYYNTLGAIYANQKKYEDAIKYYKKAIELNKKYPKCLINLGVLLLNKGEYKESCRYLIDGLKIFDDIPEAWNYLLSNVIELDEEDLIYDINNKNLKNIENCLFKNK